MADISFLLLIFFLVATTINPDIGIGMVLPPPSDHEPPRIKDRNMLAVLLNANGEIMIEERPADITQLRVHVTNHVMNCATLSCASTSSESPERAIVSIKVDQRAEYRDYIRILDEVWLAYFEVWDTEAIRLGFADYQSYLASSQYLGSEDNVIRQAYPANISIAEPN